MEKAYYIGQIKDDVNDIVIDITDAVAEYDNIETPTNRYSLTVMLNNNGKRGTLTAIMFNPSEKAIKERSPLKNKPTDLTMQGKKKTFVDGTITNVIRIANRCGYSRIVILNLFSIINPKPEEILKNPKKFINPDNNKKIDEILDNKNDVLIAWGNHTKEDINNLKERWQLKTKGLQKCFSLNEESKTPTHPSPYNYNKVKSFLKEKNELICLS